jgi:tetratricopeptide (TPR) repeat protein
MTEMAAKISDAALVYPSLLSESTVNIFNDMGFFKEQAKQYEEAVAILGPVSVKFPNRAVVFLNLGDAYTGLNKSAEASAFYARYVELMRDQGKEKKIPKRITSLFSGK